MVLPLLLPLIGSDPRPKTAYSYRWAADVVKKLWESCPRAARPWEQYFGINDNQLAFLLAARPTEWNIVRNMIKTLDKHLHRQAWLKQRELTKHETAIICVVVSSWARGKTCPKPLYAWLTGREVAIKLTEQYKEGQVGAPSDSDGHQLNLFPPAGD